MAPRLNKRQQRELEELDALGGPSNAQVSSEDEALIVVKPGVAGFSSFLVAEDVDEGEEVSEVGEGLVKPAKSRKKKKKKKSPAVAAEHEVETTPSRPQRSSTPATSSVMKNEKKALKKAKAKEKKIGNDELDRAIAELSSKYPELHKCTSSAPDPRSLANLLSVSLAHVDPEAEMRKFFGSRVIQASKSKPSSSGPSTSRRQANAAAQRSNLTRPQPTWWDANQREGLSMRSLTQEEKQNTLLSLEGMVDERWWTVEYSKRYKSVTKAFMQAVMAGDPQVFLDLLKKLPWHADTLLQLSEVYRHREEYAQAVDFVDRALFTYERSFLGTFTFTTGTNRLDFNHVENRPFFLAIHRQVTDLQRRGCVRTAFEFARLLYALDPWEDPHGALLHLDLLALKAGMGSWLLEVYDWFAQGRERHQTERMGGRMDPSVLPGWAYARALALRMGEDTQKDDEHGESTKALKDAILAFPSVVPLLADKLDLSISATIRGHRDFRIETDASSLSSSDAALHLLSHLYVQRSSSIWKEPTHSSWFLQTLSALFPSTLPPSLPKTSQRAAFLSLFAHPIPQTSVHRHILVLESACRRLFAFIPRGTLENVTASGALACDPLPPVAAVSRYDETFFEGVEDVWAMGGRRLRTRGQRVQDERQLAQVIPDAAVRRQLQDFFDANPEFAIQFPGGVLQFAQAVGEMPEGILEDMMAMQLAQGGGGVEGPQAPAGGMPGQMPGFEFLQEDVPREFVGRELQQLVEHELDAGNEEDEEDEEDEDEDEDVSPMPRALRNLIGRFWRRASVQDDTSDEDEEDRHLVDDNSVD